MTKLFEERDNPLLGSDSLYGTTLAFSSSGHEDKGPNEFLITEAIKSTAEFDNSYLVSNFIKTYLENNRKFTKDSALKHACRILKRQSDRIAQEIVALHNPKDGHTKPNDAQIAALVKKIEIDSFKNAATRYRVGGTVLLVLTLALVAAAVTLACIYAGYLNLDFVVQSTNLIQSMSTDLLITAGSVAGATTFVSSLGVAALFNNGHSASKFAKSRERMLTDDETTALNDVKPGKRSSRWKV